MSAGLAVGDELPHATIDVTPALVVGGAIASRDFEDVHHDTVAMKALRLRGVRSAGSSSWRRAIGLLADERRPWHLLHTHTFGLDEVARAIAVQAGRIEGEEPMHVIIDPWRETAAG